MSSQRMIRINEEIKREISATISLGLKDPRAQNALVSITSVDATNDLKSAKVYVSILAEDSKKEEVMDGLRAAGGYIRSEIARKINLRHTPELIFKLDNSMEYSAKMFKKIDEVINKNDQ